MTSPLPLFFCFVTYLLSLSLCSASEALPPHHKDLSLWLDASDPSSFVLDEALRISQWKDRRDNGIFATSKHPPQLKKDAFGGRDIVRFEGRQSMSISRILEGVKDATVFVVFRRPEDLAGEREWQKVITNVQGNRGVSLDTGKNAGKIPVKVMRGSFHSEIGPDLQLGSSHPAGWGELSGEIAEVLVYRRTFLVEEPMGKIVRYLENKWGFKEDRSNDWTHVGPLPASPRRLVETLPLSDQANEGGWQPFHEMWDEFDQPSLDSGKWWDHNPNWYGRPPARYLAREVKLGGGEMQLTMSKDPSLLVEKFYGNEVYENYSSGTIKSKKPVLYGYFEIESRAMASAASSAWWFSGHSSEIGKPKAEHKLEIDVFELGGKSPGREHDFAMNLHVFRTPESRRHWNRGGEWEAPFKFADDFHVFGLEWTEEFIRYYVDGVMVRSVKNEAWHAPMYMIFDSETMGDWLGMPKDEDLPSTFRVKYVRAWKNKETRPEWWKLYKMRTYPKNKPSPVTKYVRKMAGK